MASFFSFLTGRQPSGGEAAMPRGPPPNWMSSTEERLEDVRKSWTTDGKEPIIIWHGNAHGAMNNLENQRKHKHERKQTLMRVDGFAIAGNKNQCGLMGVVKLPDGSPHSEFNGKGIDYCIPELLTSILLACEKEEGGMDQEKCFEIAKIKVIELYHSSELYNAIFAKGGFQPMTSPTLYHYYQVFANPGENDRNETGRPMRFAAGDVRFSQSELYGIWILYTNIRVLKELSMTYIRSLPEFGEHQFLPPQIMNRINMAGRKNRTPIGARYWMNAIRDLEIYDSLTPDNEIKTSRIRALIALNNLWKTRLTNLHDILDIFTPFNLVGMMVGVPAIRVRTIDITCRTDIGELDPPDPNIPLVPATRTLDSAGSFTTNQWFRDRTTTKGPALEESGHGEEAMPDGDEATQVYNNAIEVQEDDEFYDDGERGEEETPYRAGVELENMSESGDDEWVEEEEEGITGNGGDDEWEEEPVEEETPSSRAVGAVTNPVYGKKNGSKKKKRRKSREGKKRSQKPTLRVNKSDSVLATRRGVGKVVSLKPKPTPRDPHKLLSPREGMDSPDTGMGMGGAKRKYSRKRNTRTRNRYTRRRTRRYTRRRRTPR